MPKPVSVNADERARRLANVAAILIDLGRRALAEEAAKQAAEHPAPAQEGNPT